MGRELKRVPLDFKWELSKVWKGYINPYGSRSCDCSACNGSGYSPEAEHLKNLWYGYEDFHPEDNGSKPFTPDHPVVRARAERNVQQAPEYYGTGERAIQREARRLCEQCYNTQLSHHLNQEDVDALVAGNRLWDFTRTCGPDGWKTKEPAYHPTAEEVNAWSLTGLSHDCINESIVIQARCERLGVPSTCEVCHGDGEYWPNPEDKELCEAWEPEEPPTGEGYQIWETVSEGSPISPVFATPMELATYMSEHPWGADNGSSVEVWMKFIEGPGWAPSMVMDATGIHSGVEAI